MLIFLILIFIRPFICALAFPYLNLIYTTALLIFLGAYIIYRKPSHPKMLALKNPLILFCIALCISVIFSRNRSISLGELYKYIAGIGLFLAGFSFSENNRLLVIRTVILTGVVISLLAIYQYLFSFDHVSAYLLDNKIPFPFALDYLQRRRAFLPFVTPGVLGGYLAMIIPLSLMCKSRIWFTPLIFFALILTMSPVAFLSLFCASMVYFYLRDKSVRSSILVMAAIFILIVVVFICRSATQKEYLQPAFSMFRRLNYWQENLMIIKTHPFAGVGLGNFNLQMSRYAHNSYLQILAEMGILGLFSLIWLVWVVLGSGLKNLKQTIYRKQISCLIASSVVFLVHNILDFTFFLPEVSFIWWLILGLIIV